MTPVIVTFGIGGIVGEHLFRLFGDRPLNVLESDLSPSSSCSVADLDELPITRTGRFKNFETVL